MATQLIQRGHTIALLTRWGLPKDLQGCWQA